MSSAADDKDAIRDCLARYAHALDDCRFADVAALFAEDGDWTTTYGQARGRPAIEALLTGNVPKHGEGPQRKHYITNMLITLDGDSAEARSDYLVVREGSGGLLPVMGGTYLDQFVKRNGQWFFARKQLRHDIHADMALKIKV